MFNIKLDDLLLYLFISPPSRLMVECLRWLGTKTTAKIYYENVIGLFSFYDSIDTGLRSSYLRVGRFPHGVVFFMFWFLEIVVTGIVLKLTHRI